MANDKLKQYHKVIADAWQLFKSYYPPKDDQDYWDQVLFDAGNMAELNGRTEFAISMTKAVVMELERITKNACKHYPPGINDEQRHDEEGR